MIKRLLLWVGIIAVIVVMVWVMIAASKKDGSGPVVADSLYTPVSVNDWALLKDASGVHEISGKALSDYLSKLPQNILTGVVISSSTAANASTSVAVSAAPLVQVGASTSPKAVVIVEYSDFQCPACGTYYPILKKLLPELSGDALFVYRHFPLFTIHPNAERGAIASEAAGQQGATAFWAMHDMLFEKQDEWTLQTDPNTVFKKYALELKLNPITFARDLESASLRRKVTDSYKEGVKAGIQGTPTLYVNGAKIVNPASYEELKKLVESKY